MYLAEIFVYTLTPVHYNYSCGFDGLFLHMLVYLVPRYTTGMTVLKSA